MFSDSKETEEEFISFWVIALCAVYVSPFTRVIEKPISVLRNYFSRICKEFKQICMNNWIIKRLYWYDVCKYDIFKRPKYLWQHVFT